jgi:predicted nucleotidyltransferase component of viral defense system
LRVIMKDELLRLIKEKEGHSNKLNTMREYLQNLILRILFKSGFFEYASFLGGTALRFVYGIKRYSEDLDFSLAKKVEVESLDAALERLINELMLHNLKVTYKRKIDGVYSIMIKFGGLLYEAGMSHRQTQNLNIKIEVDINPPGGTLYDTRVIDKYFTLTLKVNTLETLFAGKINAVLTRIYTKGRDYYDLFWYLTRFPYLSPNFEFLKNALIQSEFPIHGKLEDRWRDMLTEKVKAVDWGPVIKDIEVLIEDRSDLGILSRDLLLTNLWTGPKSAGTL